MYTLTVGGYSLTYKALSEALDLIALEAGWWTDGDLSCDGRQLLTWRKS
jgi:hypothetical protein